MAADLTTLPYKVYKITALGQISEDNLLPYAEVKEIKYTTGMVPGTATILLRFASPDCTLAQCVTAYAGHVQGRTRFAIKYNSTVIYVGQVARRQFTRQGYLLQLFDDRWILAQQTMRGCIMTKPTRIVPRYINRLPPVFNPGGQWNATTLLDTNYTVFAAQAYSPKTATPNVKAWTARGALSYFPLYWCDMHALPLSHFDEVDYSFALPHTLCELPMSSILALDATADDPLEETALAGKSWAAAFDLIVKHTAYTWKLAYLANGASQIAFVEEAL